MTLEEKALEALRKVTDPEVGVNIVDLGLVYSVELDENRLTVIITMTSVSCPLGGLIREQAENVLRESFPDLKEVKVDTTFDPPWSPEMMSDAAKRMLEGG
jgi:metal-sulfur cluster biosynthetic enzyme